MADTQGNGAPDAGSGGHYSGPRAVDPAPVDTHQHDPDYITRTRFLSGVAVAGGAVLTAAILVPLVGFAVTDTVKDEEWRWVDSGYPLSQFSQGDVKSIAISGETNVSDRRVFVRWSEENVFTAIWNRCAHLGCPVSFGGGNYVCPCHGGAYDSEGRVTAGPPPRPLDRFDIKVVDAQGEPVGRPGDIAGSWRVPADPPGDARVLIGKPFSIDPDLNPYRLHGPGEEVEGVLANLYPF